MVPRAVKFHPHPCCLSSTEVAPLPRTVARGPTDQARSLGEPLCSLSSFLSGGGLRGLGRAGAPALRPPLGGGLSRFGGALRGGGGRGGLVARDRGGNAQTPKGAPSGVLPSPATPRPGLRPVQRRQHKSRGRTRGTPWDPKLAGAALETGIVCATRPAPLPGLAVWLCLFVCFVLQGINA